MALYSALARAGGCMYHATCACGYASMCSLSCSQTTVFATFMLQPDGEHLSIAFSCGLGTVTEPLEMYRIQNTGGCLGYNP